MPDCSLSTANGTPVSCCAINLARCTGSCATPRTYRLLAAHLRRNFCLGTPHRPVTDAGSTIIQRLPDRYDMNVGWCAGIERSGQVRAAGFDFLEVALGPMNLENDAAFDAAKAAVARVPLPTPVFSRLLPMSMRIVGPDVDGARVRRYMARMAEVADAAGADIVVLGAGWARNVPEGWSRDRAQAQFVDTVSWCADALKDSGAIV